MKRHTQTAFFDALAKRPVIMNPPAILRGTVARIEARRGVTLTRESV